MSAMKHLAEDIMEMINEENKELLEALNALKEHNKLLIKENEELKEYKSWCLWIDRRSNPLTKTNVFTFIKGIKRLIEKEAAN